jgi:glycosyltransferase involved in cell wall biosynthesis
MKIVFIFDSFVPNETKRYLLEEILFFRSRDIDARVLSLSREDPKNTLYSESIFTKESFASLPIDNMWNWKEWRKLRIHLKSESPDVIITCGEKADVMGRFLARKIRVPKIFVFAHDSEEVKERKKIREIFLSRITDRYIVSSEEAKNELAILGISARKIAVFPDGIQFDKYGQPPLWETRRELGFLPDDFIFLFLGELSPEKRVDVLLRATAKTRGGKVLIVGDGPKKKELLLLSNQLGLSERVRFLSSHADISRLLVACDAMVLPSEKETFASSLVLGLISGLPVIAADFFGVEKLVQNGKNGLIIKKQNSDELGQAMEILLSDREKYKPGIADNKKELFRFSLPAHAANLLVLTQEK